MPKVLIPRNPVELAATALSVSVALEGNPVAPAGPITDAIDALEINSLELSGLINGQEVAVNTAQSQTTAKQDLLLAITGIVRRYRDFCTAKRGSVKAIEADGFDVLGKRRVEIPQNEDRLMSLFSLLLLKNANVLPNIVFTNTEVALYVPAHVELVRTAMRNNRASNLHAQNARYQRDLAADKLTTDLRRIRTYGLSVFGGDAMALMAWGFTVVEDSAPSNNIAPPGGGDGGAPPEGDGDGGAPPGTEG